jgi:hypothetical protein
MDPWQEAMQWMKIHGSTLLAATALAWLRKFVPIQRAMRAKFVETTSYLAAKITGCGIVHERASPPLRKGKLRNPQHTGPLCYPSSWDPDDASTLPKFP